MLDDNGEWNWNFIQSILWEVDVTEVKRIPLECGMWNVEWYINSIILLKANTLSRVVIILLSKLRSLAVTDFQMVYLQVLNCCGNYDCLKKSRYICGALSLTLYLWNITCSREGWMWIWDVQDVLVIQKTLFILFGHVSSLEKHGSSKLWVFLRGFNGGSLLYLFCFVLEAGKIEEISSFVLIIWSIWAAWNKVIFHGVFDMPEAIISRVESMGSKFLLLNHNQSISITSQAPALCWVPPTCNVLKVNVDAAVSPPKHFFGIGIVGKDQIGSFILRRGDVFRGSLHLIWLSCWL